MQVDTSYTFKTVNEAFEQMLNGNTHIALYNSNSKALKITQIKFHYSLDGIIVF